MLNCVYTLLPSARLWFEENQLLGPGLLRMEGWPVKITSIKSGIFVPLTVTGSFGCFGPLNFSSQWDASPSPAVALRLQSEHRYGRVAPANFRSNYIVIPDQAGHDGDILVASGLVAHNPTADRTPHIMAIKDLARAAVKGQEFAREPA